MLWAGCAPPLERDEGAEGPRAKSPTPTRSVARYDEEVIAAVNPRWETAQDGVVELKADLDPALEASISVEAALAGLQTSWTQGPYAGEGGVVTVRLAVPPEAFLDEAAVDYLTVLRVRVLAEDVEGHGFQVRAPNAYLTWPSGAQGAGVVWDPARAEADAPGGVVNATLRASLGARSEGHWIQPPIDHAVRGSEQK